MAGSSCALVLALVTAARAEEWDVTQVRGEARRLSYEVTEGTWMSVDVSPAGDRIVFDLLGDIYTLPIGGGEAQALTRGPAYDVQPRFSPDGSRISFTSDRGGGDNIWVIDADGSNPCAVTREDYRLLNNAVWTPDGRFLIARKHFTSRRSLGAGEMWIYPLEGGAGLQLTTRKNDQQDAGEPEVSPDGRFLYWSEDVSPGGKFDYNRDPNGVIYAILRLDRESGEVTTLSHAPGGSVRPTLSPGGDTLAFVRRVRNRSWLFLRELATGIETQAAAELSRDSQETWSIFGAYPNFDWTPDGRSLVYWAHGKLWRYDVENQCVTPIPFRATLEHVIHDAVRFHPDIGGPRFPVRVVRWPALSPGGDTAVFQALGFIWRKPLAAAEPVRITTGDDLEYAPALSRDGGSVVFVTWDDVQGGAVWTMPLAGGPRVRLTPEPGHYTEPSFSDDGEWVLFRRGEGDRYRGHAYVGKPGIYRVPSDGSAEPLWVTREGWSPRFAPGGERIELDSREGEDGALVSVDLLGGDRRVLARSQYDGEFRISPDRRVLAFTRLEQVYVVPFPATGRAVTVAPDMEGMPVRRVSEDGGEFPSWSPDSTELRFGLGPRLFRVEVAAAIAAKKDDPVARTEVALGFEAARGSPRGRVVFTGGRAITMRGDEIIEDSVVVVDGQSIAAVGRRGEVEIPGDAQVYDTSGKWILPGYVDIHAHSGASNLGISPRRKWAFLSQLSFGVTTTHDPSNDTRMIFAESELMQSGRMVAPRIYSTGTILYGAEGNARAVIDSREDALRHLRRLRSYGAFSVKSYNQPRRNQRQQVLDAARELGMMVVPEGGSMLHHNMTMILDGHTTIEHALPVAPVYDDVLTLFGSSETAYTPTLVVAYGGMFGENYWYQKSEVWANERLLRFTPRSVVDPRARRRTLIPEEEFHHLETAAAAVEVERRGGNAQIGAHGQLPGLDAHWEMWMFEQGGLTPHEMLRVATRNGAEALGLDPAIGTLEAGKLADIIVLDEDPLANPRNSSSVALVMVDGRLYDARSLDRLDPERRPLPPSPFLDSIPAAHTACGGCEPARESE